MKRRRPLSSGFVWLHMSSENPSESVKFYEKLLGWRSADGPPGMTMFAGDAGPFAGVGPKEHKITGWIPYAQVDDVDAATRRAVKLGAEVLKPKTRGPAGEFHRTRPGRRGDCSVA